LGGLFERLQVKFNLRNVFRQFLLLLSLVVLNSASLSAQPRQRIYWSDNQTRTIYRSAIDGSAIEPLAHFTAENNAGSLAIDDVREKLYWVDFITNEIFRSNLDGTSAQLLPLDLSNPRSIAVDPIQGKLYISDEFGIRISNLDGTSMQTFFPAGVESFSGLSIDPSHGLLFWNSADMSFMNASIFKALLSNAATAAPIVNITDGLFYGLVANAQTSRVFFSHGILSQIRSAKYDGTNQVPQTSLANAAATRDMALDFPETALFYADTASNGIFRTELSSPGSRTLVVFSEDPYGVVLDCGRYALDSDLDGFGNCRDACPNDSAKNISPGVCGCGVPDTDDDKDGIPNCIDSCPLDPLKNAPGICGCGLADIDSDLDGKLDCSEECPNNPAKIQAGACGCGSDDKDSDGDGILDCSESCPNDKLKTTAGICGCGMVDADSDSDGVIDCQDACPSDFRKSAPGSCGCGKIEDFNSKGQLVCVKFRQLTPLTKLLSAPVVIVQNKTIKLLLEKFSSATLKKIKTGKATEYVFEVEEARKARSKVSVRYEIIISRTDTKKRDVKTATTKRNEYTLRNLKSGAYSAKYRAQLVSDGKVKARTKFSPSAQFKIP